MLQKYFEKLSDVRVLGRTRHNLLEIVVMTICAVVSGCEFWWQIEDFCKVKADWFRERLGLKLQNGVASHDTFQRVLSLIKPKEFESCFTTWVKAVCKKTDNEIVSIDGKTLRGSKKGDSKALHLVSAWANKNQLVLGQISTEAKSNEITAIPNLLDVLELKNCIITIDAMGTQKEIAAKIVTQESDYVLAVKENQPKLHKDIWMYFDECLCNEKLYFGETKFQSGEKGHGRIEKRTYYLTTDIDWLPQKEEWQGIKAIGMVNSVVDRSGTISQERRYYITTLDDVKIFAQAARAHWGIENSLHWCLDVTFNEDRCRTRKDNSAENFAVIRHIAINLMKNYSTAKPMSLNAKRLKCQYDCEFMSNVLLSAFTSC